MMTRSIRSLAAKQPFDKLETLWADGHSSKLKELAKSLVDQKVDLIVASGGTRAAEAAKEATKNSNTLVVFTSVAHSFAHQVPFPANMTGVCAHTSDLNARRVEG